jgi:hypothetical protein
VRKHRTTNQRAGVRRSSFAATPRIAKMISAISRAGLALGQRASNSGRKPKLTAHQQREARRGSRLVRLSKASRGAIMSVKARFRGWQIEK